MSSNVVVCTIDQELKDELKKFRYSKAKEGSAIIMKVRMGEESYRLSSHFYYYKYLQESVYLYCPGGQGEADGGSGGEDGELWRGGAQRQSANTSTKIYCELKLKGD